MKGQSTLMGGVAVLAMLAAASAASAATTNSNGTDQQAQTPATGYVLLAQNDTTPPTTAELETRIEALEAEVQQSEMNAAQAANAPPPPPPSGWWSNTTISGRMYFDVTNSSVRLDNARDTRAGNGNGTGFDIKRFYIGIDHTFNDMFSANVTTDTTYDSTTKAGQIYLKKAYLQAKIDPLLTVRLGSADLPWVPYVEGIYGMRYFENTLIDRTKFGTSADWGVHALGTAFGGILNYDVAAIDGAGYKVIPIGGGVNHPNELDYEGRISAVYDGFNVAIGGYTGKLGTASGTATFHTATRVDVLAAYVGNGLRAGVEYFEANDYSAALVQTAGAGDGANGVSGFASYNFVDFLPEWSVFGRYDSVDPTTISVPTKTDQYYTFGVTWHPVNTVDLSLAYKHEAVSHGTIATSNGTLGAAGTGNYGLYNEVGVWGDFQF